MLPCRQIFRRQPAERIGQAVTCTTAKHPVLYTFRIVLEVLVCGGVRYMWVWVSVRMCTVVCHGVSGEVRGWQPWGLVFAFCLVCFRVSVLCYVYQALPGFL